jgi:putative phage-type endonuclease
MYTKRLIVDDQIIGMVTHNSFSNTLTDLSFNSLRTIVTDHIISYIPNNILSFSDPKYHINIFKEITNNIKCLCSHTESEITSVLYHVMTHYFNNIVPRRSYPTTFIRNINSRQDLQNKIDYLINVPQPPQRSEEWYKFRHDLITASSASKALGSQAGINSIIYEKCKPLDLDKSKGVCITSPFHHGLTYEPISIAIYEKMYNTKVEDFGCIQDKMHPYIGASPDGISTDRKSPLFARMVEVKNVVSREITGIPKKEYWIQMQIQMGVCKLNECDFLETKFVVYEDMYDFASDGTFNLSHDNKTKGIFMFFMIDGKPLYEYPPIGQTSEEFMEWEAQIMLKHDKETWNNNIYWKLDVFSCVLVLRNQQWFDAAAIKLGEVWKTILEERVTGYEHRAPKKRVPKIVEEELPIEEDKCVIVINNIPVDNT